MGAAGSWIGFGASGSCVVVFDRSGVGVDPGTFVGSAPLLELVEFDASSVEDADPELEVDCSVIS